MQSVGFEFQKSKVQDCSTSSKWWERCSWREDKPDVEIGHICFLAFCCTICMRRDKHCTSSQKKKIIIKSSDKSMYCRKELKVAAVTHISLTLWQPQCCNAFMFSPREMLYSDLSHSSSWILWQKKRSLLKVCVVQNFTILGPMPPSLGGYILGVLNVSEAMIFCVWRTVPTDPLEEVNTFGVWPKAPTDLRDSSTKTIPTA